MAARHGAFHLVRCWSSLRSCVSELCPGQAFRNSGTFWGRGAVPTPGCCSLSVPGARDHKVRAGVGPALSERRALLLTALPLMPPGCRQCPPRTCCSVPRRAPWAPQHSPRWPSVLPSAAASLSLGPLDSGSRQPPPGLPTWPQAVWTAWVASAHRWLSAFVDHIVWGACWFFQVGRESEQMPRLQDTYLHLEGAGGPGRCGTALPPQPWLSGPGCRPPGNTPSSAPHPAHFGHITFTRPRAESPQDVDASVISANRMCRVQSLTRLCCQHLKVSPQSVTRTEQLSAPLRREARTPHCLRGH